MKSVKFGNKNFDTIQELNDALPQSVTSLKEGRRYTVRFSLGGQDLVGTRSELVKAAIALYKNADERTIEERQAIFNEIKDKIEPLLTEKRSFLRRIFGFNPAKAITKAEADVEKQQRKIESKVQKETAKLAENWFKNNDIKTVKDLLSDPSPAPFSSYKEYFLAHQPIDVLKEKIPEKLLNQLTKDKLRELYLNALQGAVRKLKNRDNLELSFVLKSLKYDVPEPEKPNAFKALFNEQLKKDLKEKLRDFFGKEAKKYKVTSEEELYDVLQELRDNYPEIPELHMLESGLDGFVDKGGAEALQRVGLWKCAIKAITDFYEKNEYFGIKDEEKLAVIKQLGQTASDESQFEF